jgi:hypothetical protein
VVVGALFGWCGGRRSKRATYSYRHQTPTADIRADNLTADEITRCMNNFENAYKKLTHFDDGKH